MTKINLIDIKPLLEGRKWQDLTKDERMEISQKIADQISQT